MTCSVRLVYGTDCSFASSFSGKDGRKPPTDVTDLSGYTYIDPSKGPSLTESPLTVDAIDSVASRRWVWLVKTIWRGRTGVHDTFQHFLRRTKRTL